nr:signal recognition particle subunit SRP14 [Cryptococcus depauperatus CBS 7841]
MYERDGADWVTEEQFLAKLGQCFLEPSSSSSIWLTHKRLPVPSDADVRMDDTGADNTSVGSEESEYEVLIRCTQGDNKFSTKASKADKSKAISASSLSSFHAAYGALLKQSMAPLMRKRDKKKEKARTDALAKKRKELYVDVAIGNEGKRGKGRRQRQRRIAAQRKKEAERERLESRQTQQQGNMDL